MFVNKIKLMKIFLRFLVVFPMLIFALVSHAQNTVQMLNGKTVVIGDYNWDEQEELLLYFTKKGKIKDLDKYSIFSIVDSVGNEILIYEPDTFITESFSIDQMRTFIDGEREALENFKCPFATAAGVIVGVSSPVFLQPFYAFAPPAIATASMEFVDVRQKRVFKKYPEKASDYYFVQGYREAASAKRMDRVMKGSLGGFVLGIAIAVIYKSIN